MPDPSKHGPKTIHVHVQAHATDSGSASRNPTCASGKSQLKANYFRLAGHTNDLALLNTAPRKDVWRTAHAEHQQIPNLLLPRTENYVYAWKRQLGNAKETVRRTVMEPFKEHTHLKATQSVPAYPRACLKLTIPFPRPASVERTTSGTNASERQTCISRSPPGVPKPNPTHIAPPPPRKRSNASRTRAKSSNLEKDYAKAQRNSHLTSEDLVSDRRKQQPAGPDLPSPGHVVNRPHSPAHSLKRIHSQETPQPRPHNPTPPQSTHLPSPIARSTNHYAHAPARYSPPPMKAQRPRPPRPLPLRAPAEQNSQHLHGGPREHAKPKAEH